MKSLWIDDGLRLDVWMTELNTKIENTNVFLDLHDKSYTENGLEYYNHD